MFICTGCQKEYENQTKFCSECGGKVTEKIEIPTEVKYICSGCQREYEAQTKFCSECGGKIEEKVFELITETKFICSGCQKEFNAATKFCSECGGKIAPQDAVVKRPATPAAVTPAEATPAAVTVNDNNFIEQLIKQFMLAMSNNALTLQAVKKAENIYSISVKNALLEQSGDFLFEHNANGSSAKLLSSKTSPGVLGWIFLVLPITFWFMIPCFFLLLKPLYKKVIIALLHNINAAFKHPNAYVFPVTPAFDPQGKSAQEIADICFTNLPQMLPGEFRISKAGVLDNFVLNNALSSYAMGVSPDNVICMVDSTPVGAQPGSFGVIFATDKVYYKYKILNTEVTGVTDYKDITGSFCTNAAIKGDTLKYNVILSNTDNKKSCLIGQVASECSGDIPEAVLIFMAQCLMLVQAMSQSAPMMQPAPMMQSAPGQSAMVYGAGNCVQVSENVSVKLPFLSRLFQKRLKRMDFWLIVLIALPFSFIPVIGSFVALWIIYTAGSARLHDSNRSGWNLAWVFLPLIGNIILIIYWCMPSTEGPNRFGPVPQKVFGS